MNVQTVVRYCLLHDFNVVFMVNPHFTTGLLKITVLQE